MTVIDIKYRYNKRQENNCDNKGNLARALNFTKSDGKVRINDVNGVFYNSVNCWGLV